MPTEPEGFAENLPPKNTHTPETLSKPATVNAKAPGKIFVSATLELERSMSDEALAEIEGAMRDWAQNVIRSSETASSRRHHEITLLPDAVAGIESMLNPVHPKKPKSAWFFGVALFFLAAAAGGAMSKLNDLQENGKTISGPEHYLWYIFFGLLSCVFFCVGWAVQHSRKDEE